MSELVYVMPVSDEDSKEIFDWRNNLVTREMSHSTAPVDWEGHCKWFKSTLQNESRCLLMCLSATNKDKVAVVRFDIDDDFATISINLSPDKRGKGLAKACLLSAIDYLYRNFSSIKYLEAEIKSINILSQKIFERIGFCFQNEHDGVKYYTYNKSI
jgi:RimJ/RimL family protein N-acetyltransferase